MKKLKLFIYECVVLHAMVSSIKDQDDLDRLRAWANFKNMSLSQFIASDVKKQSKAMVGEIK